MSHTFEMLILRGEHLGPKLETAVEGIRARISPTAARGADFRGHQVRSVGESNGTYLRITPAHSQSGEGSRNCGASAECCVRQACGGVVLRYKVPETKPLRKES